jgi:hypothetical protein
MKGERIFYCAVDSDQYYFKMNEFINNNNYYIYFVENSDITIDEFLSVDEAYCELFKQLNEYIDNYFYNETDNETTKENFFYKTFQTEKTYINNELLNRMKENNLVIVKNNTLTPANIFCKEKKDIYYILTNRIYDEFKQKYKLNKHTEDIEDI